MYLHLGQDIVVPEASVIGIFDLDNTTGSQITREFLNEAEKNGRVTAVSEELPKSFVVCGGTVALKPPGGRDGIQQIYLSQLSSQTLLKRTTTEFGVE